MTTCLGKSCSFGLPRVPFINCCQYMYLVVFLLVLRAAYLFTLDVLIRSIINRKMNILSVYNKKIIEFISQARASFPI